jgi:hypothetical protein
MTTAVADSAQDSIKVDPYDNKVETKAGGSINDTTFLIKDYTTLRTTYSL